MRRPDYKSAFLIFVATIALCNCKQSTRFTFIAPDIDSAIKPVKISILELVDNYKNYQGKYIETTGQFNEAFEEFAIYTNYTFSSDKRKGFWLDIDLHLKIDNEDFEKMNGKTITIKGVVDTSGRGHLSQYLATIKRIYFWQQHR